MLSRLGKYELFAELDREDLEAIADRIQEERFRAGQVLCQQGEIGRTAYFIESGILRVLRYDPQGIEQEVDRLDPGDYFGETSLLLSEPRDATIQVVEDATLLYLRKEDLQSVLSERPELLDRLQLRPEVLDRLHAPRFTWQEADESVILSLRKHIAVLIRNLILPGFVFLACLLGIAYLGSFSGTAWSVGAGLSLIPLLFSLYLTLDYYNDRYVLTDRRVVHDERHLLIYESRNEAPLRTIQDVQQVQEGPLAHMFDYGDLIVETAGERGHIIFLQIPRPEETREMIFQQITRIQAVARAEEREAIRTALRTKFGLQPVDFIT